MTTISEITITNCQIKITCNLRRVSNDKKRSANPQRRLITSAMRGIECYCRCHQLENQLRPAQCQPAVLLQRSDNRHLNDRLIDWIQVYKNRSQAESTIQCKLQKRPSIIISASLSISTASGVLMLRNVRLDRLLVCRSAVYCGKTADWIRMSFGWWVIGLVEG